MKKVCFVCILLLTASFAEITDTERMMLHKTISNITLPMTIDEKTKLVFASLQKNDIILYGYARDFSDIDNITNKHDGTFDDFVLLLKERTAKRLCSMNNTKLLLEMGFTIQNIYIDKKGGNERINMKINISNCTNFSRY